VTDLELQRHRMTIDVGAICIFVDPLPSPLRIQLFCFIIILCPYSEATNRDNLLFVLSFSFKP